MSPCRNFAAEAPEGPAADAPPDGPDAGDVAEGSGELLQDDGSEDKGSGEDCQVEESSDVSRAQIVPLPKESFL